MLNAAGHDLDPQLLEPAAESGSVYRFIQAGTADQPDLPYYLYLPAGEAQPQRVLVAVHGISRNVDEHLAAMRSWADEYATALVLPVYDKLDFHDYQRLGRSAYGARADLPLLRALDDIASMFGIDTERVALFGFSGGAQFAHRFALMHGARVSALGLASAGWYTWPDPEQAYPFGMADAMGLPGAGPDIDRLLQIPTCVFVGERDTQRDRALNTATRIDTLQGRNRVERAHNWSSAMRGLALSRGIDSRMRLQLLPHTRHSYLKAVTRGQLMSRLFSCFYDDQGVQ